VLTRRAFSGNFRTESEIHNLVPISNYATIPRRRGAELKSGVFATGAGSPFGESFRLLQRKLSELPVVRKSCILLVTSAVEFDGKTTIAANIAKVLADEGRRVLFVDADLHCGNAHETFGLPAGPGLAEALRDGGKPQIVSDNVLRFRLLRAGKDLANPTEFLDAARLKGIFTMLREEFDFIVMDSPPLPLVSDALMLAKFADIVLSVARIEHTPRRAFAAHCNLLSGTNCVHGLIVNGADGGAGYGAATRTRRSRRGFGQNSAPAFAGRQRRPTPRLPRGD
jgi:capsular exopolysaccharide synthesis family protein